MPGYPGMMLYMTKRSSCWRQKDIRHMHIVYGVHGMRDRPYTMIASMRMARVKYAGMKRYSVDRLRNSMAVARISVTSAMEITKRYVQVLLLPSIQLSTAVDSMSGIGVNSPTAMLARMHTTTAQLLNGS